MHSDDKTIITGAAIALAAVLCWFAISSWKQVEIARATGKSTTPDEARLTVSVGVEGAGGNE